MFANYTDFLIPMLLSGTISKHSLNPPPETPEVVPYRISQGDHHEESHFLQQLILSLVEVVKTDIKTQIEEIKTT